MRRTGSIIAFAAITALTVSATQAAPAASPLRSIKILSSAGARGLVEGCTAWAEKITPPLRWRYSTGAAIWLSRMPWKAQHRTPSTRRFSKRAMPCAGDGQVRKPHRSSKAARILRPLTFVATSRCRARFRSLSMDRSSAPWAFRAAMAKNAHRPELTPCSENPPARSNPAPKFSGLLRI